ncbi:unnamed protein product [Pylaiella littoralis]
MPSPSTSRRITKRSRYRKAWLPTQRNTTHPCAVSCRWGRVSRRFVSTIFSLGVMLMIKLRARGIRVNGGVLHLLRLGGSVGYPPNLLTLTFESQRSIVQQQHDLGFFLSHCA